MKRVLKWAGYGLAGLVLVLLCAAGGAFAASEAIIRWPVAKPPVRIAASKDTGAVERGRRVAKLNGCHDCHGENLEGRLFHDDALMKAWAPNLTLLAGRSDADLDRAIRHGVGADGRRLWIMPSSAFASLTDAEAADLIAYVRAFEPQGVKQPRFKPSAVARLGVLLGKFKSEPDTLKARAGLAPADVGPQFAEGRQTARACVECHGAELKGGGILEAPDLTVAAAYDPEDFAKLMRTGKAAGDRELRMMSGTSRSRFSGLSDQEIAALHAYLKARADKVIAAAEAGTLATP
jgi:mono/diheme cytochrome c family protein